MKARIKTLDEIVRLEEVHIVEVAGNGTVKLEVEQGTFFWMSTDMISFLGTVQNVQDMPPKGLISIYRVLGRRDVIPANWLEILPEEPLPCPWCGATPRILKPNPERWAVGCGYDQCPLSVSPPNAFDLSREQAIQRWNDRKG